MDTKDKIFNGVQDFLLAIAAGAAIALGGIAFLSAPNKTVGSIYFAIGLFTVCYFGLNLYTGKVCYVFNNKASYLGKLAIILAGNFVGATMVGAVAALTRLNALQEACATIVNTKLSDNLLSIFILAILCDICIFIAVDGFAKAEQGVIKVIALLFGVAVFVLCGFEHCVANMFYITFAGMWSWKALGYMAIMILGNSIGGVLLPLILKATKKQ